MSKIPEKLTDETVVDVDFFREDIVEMQRSIDQIDELANRIDTDLKNIYFDHENRSLIGRGVMSHTSNMIESLTSLRTAKVNGLNQLLGNKIKISQMTINKKKIDSGELDATAIAKEFNRLFIENNKRLSPENPQRDIIERANSIENNRDDDLLDQRINDLQTQGDLKFTDNELAIKYEKDGVVFKIANSKTQPLFVPCNETTGEIIEDYPSTLYPNPQTLMTAILSDDGKKMTTGGGKEYEVIS